MSEMSCELLLSLFCFVELLYYLELFLSDKILRDRDKGTTKKNDKGTRKQKK